MKILVVSQYFWPENFRINDLVEGLVVRGHEVTIVTGIPNYPEGRFYPGYGLLNKIVQYYRGAKIFRVPLIARGNGSKYRLLINYLSFACFASIVAPFYLWKQYDVVFVYAPSPITVAIPGLVMKKLKSVPMFLWVQDLWPESLSATGAVSNKWILRGVGSLVRLIFRFSDRILVPSKAYISSVLDHGGEPGHVDYFPQCVESLYQPIQSKVNDLKDDIFPTGFCVMFAGNIGTAQSFETVLDAAEKVKHISDINIVILGDGRMRQWVASEVKRRRLGDTVHLLERRPLEDMPVLFANAEVMLVTLKKNPLFSLTIPGKIQSYLACGRPIIGALEGEAARIINESGAGLVCPPEDSAQLAHCIMKMFEMSERQRNHMGRSGLNYYRINFDRDVLIDRLELWMKECVVEPK